MRASAFPGLVAFAGIVLAAGSASAHSVLVSPTPRSTADGLQQGPCGGVPPTGNPTVFQAGTTITVKWRQDADHGGTYRIAFSPGNDQGFNQNVLADNIPDQAGSSVTYTHQVTLPDTPCTGCTIQLLQKAGPYYSCADIELVAPQPPDAGASVGVDAGSFGGGGSVDAGSFGGGGSVDAGSFGGGGSVDAGSFGGGVDAGNPSGYYGGGYGVDAGNNGNGNGSGPDNGYGSGSVADVTGGCAITAGAGGHTGAGALSIIGLALAAAWISSRRSRRAL